MNNEYCHKCGISYDTDYQSHECPKDERVNMQKHYAYICNDHHYVGTAPCLQCQMSNPTKTDKAKTEQLGSNMDQVPFEAIDAIGRIFAEGEVKYGRDNWKKGINDIPYQRERLNHAIRHLMLYANGDLTEPHLAKVAWFCVTQLFFDAPPKPPFPDKLKPNQYLDIKPSGEHS